jgi:hypothetical protein
LSSAIPRQSELGSRPALQFILEKSVRELEALFVLFILVALAVLALAVLTPQYGIQACMQELKGIVEPLGFDVLSKLDDKSSEHCSGESS